MYKSTNVLLLVYLSPKFVANSMARRFLIKDLSKAFAKRLHFLALPIPNTFLAFEKEMLKGFLSATDVEFPLTLIVPSDSIVS